MYEIGQCSMSESGDLKVYGMVPAFEELRPSITGR